MAKNVFILGAGASVESGPPLMSNFVDVIEDIFFSKESSIDRPAFNRVLSVHRELQSVYAKSYLALDNIEHLFGAIELSSVMGQLYGHTTEDIALIRESLIKVIAQTIELTTRFPFLKYKGSHCDAFRINPTESYGAFVDLLKESNVKDCCVITFNYDLALDVALSLKEVPINYGYSSGVGMRLLKLHGSLNWGTCSNPACSSIVIYDINNYFNTHRRSLLEADFADGEAKQLPIQMLNSYHEVHCPNCTKQLDKIGLIVPPTWNKGESQKSIATVWQNAAKELSEAVNIFAIGYSLPETDSFFRYLFALGTLGNARIRRFWTFDPDPDVHNRFQDMIGRSIKDRFKKHEVKFYEGATLTSSYTIILNEMRKEKNK